jgi:hypothetical protein
MSFKDLAAITEFQEGSIVRCMTRLDELCKDFQKAAVVVGNQSLHRKMEVHYSTHLLATYIHISICTYKTFPFLYDDSLS